MKYRITFDRISRDHDVPPLVTNDTDATGQHLADLLAWAITRYAKPRMVSRDIGAIVDLDKMSGSLTAGFHSGGEFTIEPVLDEVPSAT